MPEPLNELRQLQHEEVGQRDGQGDQSGGNVPAADLNKYGLPRARDRPSPFKCLRNLLAVIDHLSFAECAGFTGSAFGEVQIVCR